MATVDELKNGKKVLIYFGRFPIVHRILKAQISFIIFLISFKRNFRKQRRSWSNSSSNSSGSLQRIG